jgi:hypothetical protein
MSHPPIQRSRSRALILTTLVLAACGRTSTSVDASAESALDSNAEVVLSKVVTDGNGGVVLIGKNFEAAGQASVVCPQLLVLVPPSYYTPVSFTEVTATRIEGRIVGVDALTAQQTCTLFLSKRLGGPDLTRKFQLKNDDGAGQVTTPTATLVANGVTGADPASGAIPTLSVYATSLVDYTWSSSNATSGASTFRVDVEDRCGTVPGGELPWGASGTKGDSRRTRTDDCQAGGTYTVTYTATADDGATARSALKIAVLKRPDAAPPLRAPLLELLPPSPLDHGFEQASCWTNGAETTCDLSQCREPDFFDVYATCDPNVYDTVRFNVRGDVTKLELSSAPYDTFWSKDPNPSLTYANPDDFNVDGTAPAWLRTDIVVSRVLGANKRSRQVMTVTATCSGAFGDGPTATLRFLSCLNHG